MKVSHAKGALILSEMLMAIWLFHLWPRRHMIPWIQFSALYQRIRLSSGLKKSVVFLDGVDLCLSLRIAVLTAFVDAVTNCDVSCSCILHIQPHWFLNCCLWDWGSLGFSVSFQLCPLFYGHTSRQQFKVDGNIKIIKIDIKIHTLLKNFTTPQQRSYLWWMQAQRSFCTYFS